MAFILKQSNDDFIVKELINEYNLLYNHGEDYTYIEVRKKGIRTVDMMKTIAEKMNILIDEISYAGLKDEDAITFQTIAIKGKYNVNNLPYFSIEDDFFEVLQIVGYSKFPINIGNLLGNIFNIQIRGISEKEMKGMLSLFNKHTLLFPFINYYGEQRFGLPGKIHNTHLIGKAIINNNMELVKRYLTESGQIYENTSNEDTLKIIDSQKTFFINSYMSFLWNLKLDKEIMRFGKCIYEINTFPISLHICKDLESIYRNRYISYTYYSKRGKDIKIKSTYWYYFEQVKVRLNSYEKNIDGSYSANVSFVLKEGSYATMLIKQLERTVQERAYD